MRISVVSGAIFGCVLCLTACDKPGQSGSPKPDKNLIQGTWAIQKLNSPAGFHGGPGPAPNDYMQFDGDIIVGVNNGMEERGTFTIDSQKSPKEIDLSIKTPTGTTDVMKAIYELNGDTLRIAMDVGPSGARPTSFQGTQVMTVEFQRKK